MNGSGRPFARHWWRARLVVRDGARVITLLGRAIRAGAAGYGPATGLAVVAGPPSTRAGTLATYVVTVCNQTATGVRLRLVAHGTSNVPHIPAFHVEASIDVPALGAVTYRLTTAWDGRASLTPSPDAIDPVVDAAVVVADCAAHCDVGVELLRDRVRLDRLCVRTLLIG